MVPLIQVEGDDGRRSTGGDRRKLVPERCATVAERPWKALGDVGRLRQREIPANIKAKEVLLSRVDKKEREPWVVIPKLKNLPTKARTPKETAMRLAVSEKN